MTSAAGAEVDSSLSGGFETYEETKSPGLVRRFFTIYGHTLGLIFGGLAAWLRGEKRRGLKIGLLRLVSASSRPFLNKDLLSREFPEQLRRRFEKLGPTFIKLGQVLSLREDLLPRSITDELKNLLAHLPAVPYARFLELLQKGLGTDPLETFAYIESTPVGSASIAQAHRAGTHEGDAVILKVVKPGIRKTLYRDTVLLKLVGRFLQFILPRYHPRDVIDEFCEYTLREVDLVREADSAETFAANFSDDSNIHFPRIFRQYCSRDVLCMEYLRGYRPDSEKARELSPGDRNRLVDLGSKAIIRMLYRDGFFHADLHPGNLLVLPGPKCGFIDFGMVGRIDEDIRRRHLYYYYSLVVGDAESAARYLTSLARPSRHGDPKGFRRHVEETCRRWRLRAKHENLALGKLVLESISQGARFRMYFPVEMVLMVKAIITFEGVGHILSPGLDVTELSRRHLTRLLIEQFSPRSLIREGIKVAPEVVDAMMKAPMLITQGLKVMEAAAKAPEKPPLSGLRGAILAGFSLVSGAVVLALQGPPLAYAGFFLAAVFFAITDRQ